MRKHTPCAITMPLFDYEVFHAVPIPSVAPASLPHVENDADEHLEGRFTLKQRLFIEAYMGRCKGNGRRAAEEAGYRGNGPGLEVTACRNLKIPMIRAEVERRIGRIAQRVTSVTQHQSLYLIREQHGLTKIGIATNVDSRFYYLQQGCPYVLTLLLVLECDNALKLERALHRRFTAKRVRGEWFSLDEADIQYIKGLNDGQQETVNDPEAKALR